MRLKRILPVFLLAQIFVAGLVTAFTYMDYHIERDKLIMGDLLTLRLMTLGKEYGRSFRSGFYDADIGIIAGLRAGRVPDVSKPDFTRTSERIVEVILLEDLKDKNSPEIGKIMDSPMDVVLNDMGSEISVASKLYRAGEDSPYGVIKIVNTPRGLVRQVVRRNLLIYLLVFLLVNGQAALFTAIVFRRKDIVFQKGYLKEHAIGALKLQHKILGDIIKDHEDNDKKGNQNVISFPK